MQVDFGLGLILGLRKTKEKFRTGKKKAQVLGRVFKTRPTPSFLKTRIYWSKTGPKTWAKAPF